MDFRTLAIVALAIAASAYDLRTRRLPNALTFGAALAGFAYQFALGGPSGLGLGVAGWLIAVALFFPFFALRGLGAGDVKLLGAFGAWLGPMSALYMAFYTGVAGGVMALVVVLARRRVVQTFSNLGSMIMFWSAVGVQPMPSLTLESSTSPRLAYALPIAVGALVALWLV